MIRNWILLLVLVAPVIKAGSKYNSIHKKDASDYSPSNGNGNGNGIGGGNGGGLFPNVFNLATRAHITVNATCGEQEPEVYCKLVEHVLMRAPQCGVCDAAAPDIAKRHPKEHMIDGTTRWWQSPSLQHGLKFEWVTITLDLKQIYQVAYVIVKCAISPRPANWILEHSTDNITYRPWQYYAQTDDECWTRYGIPATRGKPAYKSDSDVICTSYYSKLNPLEGGEIHTSLVNGRAGANESSAELLEFTLARYVRLRLQKIRTLNAEFMSLSPGLDDASVTRRLFYSIKDISIGGQCVCSGHASKCQQNAKLRRPSCECQHNTCGASCERCCPMFNQLAWRAGTPGDSAECERCQCHGHADSCRFDPAVEAVGGSVDALGRRSGGGVCVNCTAHTAGINCEKCVDGWYRPWDVKRDDPMPCVPCDCDSAGSIGHCIKDDSHGGRPGACVCHEGFGGVRCERCAPGYRGYPACTPCPCDPRGTRLDDCETRCECKPNTEGERCDRCKVGHFGLSVDNELGCTACYCSGVGTICQGAELAAKEIRVDSGWLVSDMGASVTTEPTFNDETDQLVVGNYDLPGVDSYFWLAPPEYGGNRLASYGSELSFSVSWDVMRGDTSGKPTVGPDCIIIGRNGLRLASGDNTYDHQNATLSCLLVEGAWYYLPEDVEDIETARLRRTDYHGGQATRKQLMGVLADVKHLMFRAKFHTDQAEGGLWQATLPSGSALGAPSRHVERCLCPPGYIGLSCEACGYGYVRVVEEVGGGVLRDAECRKCDCNNHAATCDVVTGECGLCEHNTTGPDCADCLVGYYGDAATGNCQPCACPLLDTVNNFSPTCELDDGDYVCTNCPIGFTGDHCEICTAGFYGEPLTPGATCSPCECNGGDCDRKTGQCLGCRGNTEGWRCDQCKENHYGDPTAQDCIPCDCDPTHSASAKCDAVTGQCLCLGLLSGRRCDRCQPGMGNVGVGCATCDCSAVGATTPECDPVTGACDCRPGVTGERCDRCLEGHFGLSDLGCSGCNCSSIGAFNSTCDIVSGQCSCRPHATGTRCDICEPGFWGLGATGATCQPCGCDPVGSASSECDPTTGQCSCHTGITGPRCDRCQPGHFGFCDKGCSVCERCSAPGHVCDPDTGRCVCPTLTMGPACGQCVPNAWGFEPSKGCKQCECDVTASVRRQCEVNTGRCTCREGYEGSRCDRCAAGYHSYPNCRRCDCHLPGTLPEHCNSSGQCTCDQAGQCPCKANVGGKKCSACKDGTFGLTADNVDGCTQCFCFGRTTHCTQAGLTWGQVMATVARSATIEYRAGTKSEVVYIETGSESLSGSDAQLHISNNLKIIPGTVGNLQMGVAGIFDTPVYWQLPKQFLGDRVLSYGGFLRFSTETKGGSGATFPRHLLATHPLVQLQGNNRLVLEHYPLLPPSAPGRHEVRLHESLWRLDGKGKVTREMLMVALQNVQQVLLRAMEATDINKMVLRNVTLDTAISASGQPPPLARGVEMCECPAQYNSTSCQDPSLGFYRVVHNNSIHSTIVIQLVGEAIPCQCNKRSNICHIETGHCLNCMDNTGGPRCEKCGEGYYGDPARGPCLACPCPTTGRNFARSCRIAGGGQVTCHCKEGYTGKRCDRCSYGWYGWPQREGGSCSPCQCHEAGSVSDECHEETGQCNCRPGITGRDCSMCSRRQILTTIGCTSCDDGCTGTLLNVVDAMAARLEVGAGHLAGGVIPPPWTPLAAVESSGHRLQDMLQQWAEDREEAARRLAAVRDDDLKKKAKQLLNKASKLEKKCETAAREGLGLRTESDELLREIALRREELNAAIGDIQAYGQASAVGAVSVENALHEARGLLDAIRATELSHRSKAVQAVIKKCENFLSLVTSLVGDRSGTDRLRLDVTTLDARLNGLSNILKVTAEDLLKTNLLSEKLKKRLAATKNILQDADDVKEDVEDLAIEGGQYTEDGAFLLDEANKNLKEFNDIEDHFANLTRALEKRESLLYRLNPLYREKYIVPMQSHATMLLKRAQEIRDMFSTTRRNADFALRASQAYRNIVDALENARTAAIEASRAADVAYQKANPANTDSLLERSSIVRFDSSRLLSRAGIQAGKVTELKERLVAEQEDVATLRDSVRTAAHDDISISKDLAHLGTINSHKMAADELNRTQQLSELLTKVTSYAKQVEMNTTTFLRPKLKELDSDIQLNTVENKLTGSHGNVRQADDLLTRLAEAADAQRQKFLAWNDTLAAKLQELRNKITQARHAADGIHLSLTSRAGAVGGGCRRSYLPSNLAPSTTNSISLTYAIDTDERNASLLYLPSSKTEDFIALEMVDRRIRFLWDLGGGTGVVTNSLEIKSGNLKEEKTWYTISAFRTSNVAHLRVQPSLPPEDFRQRMASAATNIGFGRLDVGPGDEVWVGRLPDSRPLPSLLLARSAGLAGCIHKVALDGHTLGLWNYHTDTKEQCTACIEGVEELADGSSYWFNGDGYSVLHQASSSLYDKIRMSVFLKFRTLDENSLIFLAVNKEKKHVVSLSLVEGHVQLRIRYGGDARLQITTDNKYNTGNWTTIDAVRTFDRRKRLEAASLKVGTESLRGAPVPPPSQDGIPDLSDAKYFLGGVPPGFDSLDLIPDIAGSYLGCFKEVSISQQGYNPLNGNFFGVEASCLDERLKMAGFYGRGHLQLPSHALKKTANFGMVFRTINPNALIMLTTNEGMPSQSGYYSASLLGGKLEVRIDAGAGEVALLSDMSLDDGRFHTFTVEKQGRKMVLRVDDAVQSHVTLPAGNVMVRAPGDLGGLYLGGLPDGLNATHMAASLETLVGTIKDVIFDDILIYFDHPVSFERVAIGRLGPHLKPVSGMDSMILDPAPQPIPRIPSNECRKVASYSLEPGAVKFGDLPDSHVQVNFRKGRVLQKDYAIELDFRTFYPNGLLFVVPNARGKKTPYMVAYLDNKQLRVVIKGGKRKFELLAALVLNDGAWHHITLTKSERDLGLSVDSVDHDHIKYPKKLNLGNTVYLGGLPKSGIILPDNVLRLERFKGCVRALALNGQRQDLVGDKSRHHGVGQCFPAVEQGSYFPGDAYAIYQNKFVVGTLLDIELWFRTSELTGILLSVSEPNNFPALSLELNEGKVVMTGDLGDMRPFNVNTSFSTQYAVCDNQWHHVKAVFVNDELTLKVDDNAVKYGHPTNGNLDEASTNSPLYIGGLPDHAPTGTLQTRDNFKGCIRNVIIGGKRLDWTDMDALHNILLSSCPVSA